MPKRYKDLDECRPLIIDYIEDLEVGTDDNDPEKRDSGSTQRYRQDLRWFDTWLDEQSIDSPTNLTTAQANRLGRTLSNEFNGTTPRYRWDRIYAFYDWLVAMELSDSNPLDKWDGRKKDKWGMTKSTEQERHMEDGEDYAVSQDDVRLMEEHVGRNRVRDQLVIRWLWQTGMRREEASYIEIEMVDRDEREVSIPASVAKNDTPREVAYQPSLDPLLDEWLDYGLRAEMAAGSDHDYLFVGEGGARLRAARINDIVREAADRAGINRRLYADANATEDEDGKKQKNRWKITAHNIRHGFGSYMVNETDAGLWEVSKQMGHSSVDITEDIYVEDDPRAGIEHTHEYGPE